MVRRRTPARRRTAVPRRPQHPRDLGDATPEQRQTLRDLIRTRRHTDAWRADLFTTATRYGLDTDRATAAIAYLQRQPLWIASTPVWATADQVVRLREMMRTRLIPASWETALKTQLAAGTLTYDQAEHAVTDLAGKPLRPLPFRPSTATLPATVEDGYYAVEQPGAVTLYRVGPPRRGRRLVEQITAGRRRRIPGHLAVTVVAAIAANPADAARRYASISKNCAACNRPLRRTDQPGYQHGYGPDCWADRRRANTDHGDNIQPAEGPET